ncbi:MAG: HDOD domain-containing protein [Proteobacteria bacterium]|nr:HDOD domain-containing protein [Pseudomonadota bacterium]
MKLSRKDISNMLEDIPTFSQSVIRILELTADIDSSTKDLIGQISHDPILTAKVLKLVNSAYFGLARKIDSIEQSVIYVGINTIKNLAISVAAMGSLPQTNKAGLDMDNFWLHSLVTAVVAKLLARKVGVPRSEISRFFISGLLHDIGQVILSQAEPKLYGWVLEQAKELQTPLHAIEKEVFGYDHAVLGALLAKKWKLPEPIVAAILHHHDTEQLGVEQTLNSVVFVANQITKFISEDEKEISMISDFPSLIKPWLGSSFEEISASLPNLREEIGNAKVFIQFSG